LGNRLFIFKFYFARPGCYIWRGIRNLRKLSALERVFAAGNRKIHFGEQRTSSWISLFSRHITNTYAYTDANTYHKHSSSLYWSRQQYKDSFAITICFAISNPDCSSTITHR
jgi:hypothetical protein